jgi:hypothetical protein
MRLAALLAVAALAGSTSHHAAPARNAFVLLGDGRIVKLDVTRGRIVARRSLGKTPRRLPDHGPMLSVDGSKVYALVPTQPQTLVVTDRLLRIKARFVLRAEVRYRGVVRAGGRTYAFGYREGKVVDPDIDLRESDAVVTRVGTPSQSWTIRPADGHSWLEWSGSASSDGRRLALGYHGADTSGADVIDLQHEPLSPPCAYTSSGPFVGCSSEVHGAISAYGNGWVATTGSAEDLLLLDSTGNVVRRIDSGFRNEHLMSVVVDAATATAYSLATCYGGGEGLRSVALAAGTSRLVRRAPCGNDLALGPASTLLAVESADDTAGNSVIALSRSTGRILHRWRLPAYIVAVTGA